MVELVVAMGLLVMLVGLSSMVFSTSVKAHRKAAATIEISRNLRVITEQLTADFRGLRKDAPMAVLFEVQPLDTDGDGTDDTFLRYDQVLFFADGDFQAMNPVISGNLARVYYGHANSAVGNDYMTHGVLSRRAHVLTSDATLPVFPVYDPATNFNNFRNSFTSVDNNAYEYDTLTLNEWKNILDYDANPTAVIDPVNAAWVLSNAMGAGGRPMIDFTDPSTYSLLLSQGVMDLKIQVTFDPVNNTFDTAGTPPQNWRWYPSEDPAGDGSVVSDFSAQNVFGYYFNMPYNVVYDMDGDGTMDWTLGTAIPTALKFTFRLKDSNDLFTDGKTFTHIVYLDN